MIIVLHPNDDQYNALNGYTNKQSCSTLMFVSDGSGKWVVGLEVLDDPNFSEIHNQLQELERIEYTPHYENEELI